MLAHYLKAQVSVLARGGLVVPILLATYFFFLRSNPIAQHYDRWMLYVGLFITVADVVAGLWLANQSSAKAAVLKESGVLTLAQITGLVETGTHINERPLVKVNLHIAAPGFQFDTHNRVIVDIAKQGIVTRGKLVVLVDPNTRKYEIDWQASGLIAGVVPAQFTSVDDNRTYDLSGQAGPLMEILQIYKTNNLPFSGKVDLRSYPEVRQQIMAVVRRAAAQQQPAAAGVGLAAAAPPQPSVAQRLQDLENLRAGEAISDTEYAAQREKIIAEL